MIIKDREVLKNYGFEPDKTVATMTIEQLYKLLKITIIEQYYNLLHEKL